MQLFPANALPEKLPNICGKKQTEKKNAFSPDHYRQMRKSDSGAESDVSPAIPQIFSRFSEISDFPRPDFRPQKMAEKKVYFLTTRIYNLNKLHKL